MLTREQKAWIVNGFCSEFFGSCKTECPIRELCDELVCEFGRYPEAHLDRCLKIIAPNVLEEPKPENPEPTGQRFSFHYYPIVVKSDASKFTNALNKTSRKGFRPVSSGVLRQKNGVPCAWAIMFRPETPEEAKEDLE